MFEFDLRKSVTPAVPWLSVIRKLRVYVYLTINYRPRSLVPSLVIFFHPSLHHLDHINLGNASLQWHHIRKLPISMESSKIIAPYFFAI